MRELLLMRHAEAAPLAAGGTDFDRPLTARGLKAATVAARQLAQRHGAPDLLLHSTAMRTTQTAQQVHGALAAARPAMHADARIYLATADQLLAVLRDIPDDRRRVLLVGHNPAVSLLADALEPDGSHRPFAPADVRLLRLPIDRWSELESPR